MYSDPLIYRPILLFATIVTALLVFLLFFDTTPEHPVLKERRRQAHLDKTRPPPRIAS